MSKLGPVRAKQARRLLSEILQTGEVRFGNSDHAIEEMEKDQLLMSDVLNVLRAGVVRDPEWENGEWRYHVETPRIVVVICFDSVTRTIIITAWRRKK